jgi:hypothetical protein
MSLSQWRDCLCLLNPFYTFSEEEDVEDPPFLVTLEKPPVDDAFFLDQSFDPLTAYYGLFDQLDTDERFAVLSTGSRNSDSPRVNVSEDGLAEAAMVLGNRRSDRVHQLRSFNLYRMAIRASETGSQRRTDLIKEYEAFRNLLSASEPMDLQESRRLITEARSTENKKEDRLLYYQKALFFTHRTDAKVLYRGEYVLYCQSLVKGGRRITF